jgi:hypothetical protein
MDFTKSISKLEFRVLMCSNKVIFKMWYTKNILILKFFDKKFCKTQISNIEMAITLSNCKLDSSTWCNFVHIGVRHLTSYSKFGILEFSWITILKISWKKSVMAITLNKHMLKSYNWYHFVLIGVCQMILYWKLWNFEIFDNFFQIFHFP